MTAKLPQCFWYAVEDHDPNLECRHEFRQNRISVDLSDDLDATLAAQWAADDYHSNHDGWEATWPLVFVLFDTEDGPEKARRSVDREARPEFTARKIK